MATVETQDLPDPIRQLLEPHLWLLEELLPTWVCHAEVHWVPRHPDAGTLMEMTTAKEYRSADMVVTPGVLHVSEASLEQGIIHEALHVATTKFSEHADTLADTLPEASRAVVRKFLSDEYEAMTDDVAFGIQRLLNRLRSEYADTDGDGTATGNDDDGDGAAGGNDATALATVP